MELLLKVRPSEGATSILNRSMRRFYAVPVPAPNNRLFRKNRELSPIRNPVGLGIFSKFFVFVFVSL